MTLREAESEVLTWFEPLRPGRIEWSKYVNQADLASLPAKSLWDRWPTGFEVLDPTTAPSSVLAVVYASAPGIVEWRPPTPAAGERRPVADPRDTVVAMFDAGTGTRVVAMPVGEQWIGGSDLLGVLASAGPVTVAIGDAPCAATVSGTGGTSPPLASAPNARPASRLRAPLTQANLPADLRPTFRAYPLAPGTSWTWRTSACNGGVRWAAEIVTETVVAAWLEGEVAVVDSIVDVHSLTPMRNGDNLATVAGPRTRYVSPHAIAAARDDLEWSPDRWETPPPPESPFALDGVAAELIVTPLREPAITSHLVSVVDGPSDVVTPAGLFHSCWAIHVLLAQTWGAERWFCPGVGYVSNVDGGGSSYYDTISYTDLLRWKSAELPSR